MSPSRNLAFLHLLCFPPRAEGSDAAAQWGDDSDVLEPLNISEEIGTSCPLYAPRVQAPAIQCVGYGTQPSDYNTLLTSASDANMIIPTTHHAMPPNHTSGTVPQNSWYTRPSEKTLKSVRQNDFYNMPSGQTSGTVHQNSFYTRPSENTSRVVWQSAHHPRSSEQMQMLSVAGMTHTELSQEFLDDEDDDWLPDVDSGVKPNTPSRNMEAIPGKHGYLSQTAVSQYPLITPRTIIKKRTTTQRPEAIQIKVSHHEVKQGAKLQIGSVLKEINTKEPGTPETLHGTGVALWRKTAEKSWYQQLTCATNDQHNSRQSQQTTPHLGPPPIVQTQSRAATLPVNTRSKVPGQISGMGLGLWATEPSVMGESTLVEKYDPDDFDSDIDAELRPVLDVAACNGHKGQTVTEMSAAASTAATKKGSVPGISGLDTVHHKIPVG